MKKKIFTLVVLAIFIAVVNLASGFSAGYYTGRSLQAREVTGMGGGMAQPMPPMAGRPMPIGGPPAAIAANSSFVYIVAGGKLIQYDASTLVKIKEVALETMPPAQHPMMGGERKPSGPPEGK